VLLVSQLASHPMFEISAIYQHTSFNQNSRSRRSLGLRTVGDATSMRALGHSPFKQIRDEVVQSKRISSFAREFSHNSP